MDGTLESMSHCYVTVGGVEVHTANAEGGKLMSDQQESQPTFALDEAGPRAEFRLGRELKDTGIDCR